MAVKYSFGFWNRILEGLKEDENAFGPGRRNDDCVNSMIACRALGLDWVEEICGGVVPEELVDHYRRIEPYLDKWFEHGSDAAADYLL